MAKYTMLLSEYLEQGGTLPSSFELIEDFEDLFKMHYCDKEIGFETELLFRMKLEEKAYIYIPLYKERIDDLVDAYANVKLPTKVHYEKNELTMTLGEQNTKVTTLPFNAATANPSQLNQAEETENENVEEKRWEDSGLTPDEAIKTYNFINDKVHSIIMELLNEFKTLFMGVY